MPFSVLLLTGISSERHITGDGGDRVVMEQRLLPEEVVLFFDKVDKDPIRVGLGMSNQKCCDGIIFYVSKAQKTICLVEMKHTDLGEARDQIKQTYDRLCMLLKQECSSCPGFLKQIVWQAYIYHSGTSAKGGYRDHEDNLKQYGFKDVWVRSDRDISKYLRMEISADLRNKKTRHHSH